MAEKLYNTKFLVVPGAPTRPSTPKMLRVKERAPIPYFFVVFILDSHLVYQGAWEHVKSYHRLWNYF